LKNELFFNAILASCKPSGSDFPGFHTSSFRTKTAFRSDLAASRVMLPFIAMITQVVASRLALAGIFGGIAVTYIARRINAQEKVCFFPRHLTFMIPVSSNRVPGAPRVSVEA
jgi:hypothetical protein